MFVKYVEIASVYSKFLACSDLAHTVLSICFSQRTSFFHKKGVADLKSGQR